MNVQLTPVQQYGDIWLKRDDLWDECGVAHGGKARTAGVICRSLAANNVAGAVCCLDRSSSVPGMLSRVFRHYGRTLDVFMPKSKEELPVPFKEAQFHGATLHEVYPGYMSVRQKRARELAEDMKLVQLGVGLFHRDLGMEETAYQVQNVPRGAVQRIVVPVGSGGMLMGVAAGVERYFGGTIPVIGVHVGDRPKRKYPVFVGLAWSGREFGKEISRRVGDVELDPVYEAHCHQYLEPGDLLWIVAHRSTE